MKRNLSKLVEFCVWERSKCVTSEWEVFRIMFIFIEDKKTVFEIQDVT